MSSTVMSYVSTPEPLATIDGQLFLVFRKALMVLDEHQLSFARAGRITFIPLAGIRGLSIGHLPRVMNPLGIDFISVTYDEGPETKRLFFCPCDITFPTPSRFNRFVVKWFNAIRTAIVAATGCEPGNTPADQLGTPRSSVALVVCLVITVVLPFLSAVGILLANQLLAPPSSVALVVFLVVFLVFCVLLPFLADVGILLASRASRIPQEATIRVPQQPPSVDVASPSMPSGKDSDLGARE